MNLVKVISTPAIFVMLFLLGTAFTNSTFEEKTTVEYNSNADYLNYGVPVDQLVYGPIDKSLFSILVQKSSYSTFLKYNGRVIKSYPCVFGESPIEDKRMQGDMRTPEGQFRITDIRRHEIWGFFMELDYPNHHSWNKHKEAKVYHSIPENADIGGDIGIHGLVEGLEYYIDSKNNWTEGCVSLKNIDVYEMARYLKVGTPVTIVY